MYRTFLRTWWKENPTRPNGLEPSAGRKSYRGEYPTAEEAIAACREYNATHPPGRLSRKMEFEKC